MFVGNASTPSALRGHDFPELYENNDLRGFLPIGPCIGLDTITVRGNALADYDDGGSLDIHLVNNYGRLQLFQNQTRHGGNYLKIRLEPTMSNLDGFGALVYMEPSDRIMLHQLKSDTSTNAQDFSELHFGLEDKSVDKITVRWTSGQVTEITDVSPNTTFVVKK